VLERVILGNWEVALVKRRRIKEVSQYEGDGIPIKYVDFKSLIHNCLPLFGKDVKHTALDADTTSGRNSSVPRVDDKDHREP